MSYATLTKQCINIKHTWKMLFFRIPSKNDICDETENKLKSGKHILIISMTDAIGLRNIHILNLPIQTYMYLSKLYSIEYGLFVNSYTCFRFIGG
jgi:hypothetical protein